MEQQTISIAKAGITTILNSRTSVLAAANPVQGRYDDLKHAAEQIDFQSAILSRFDCIFIVRDIRDQERDKRLAEHVIDLQMGKAINDMDESEFDLDLLRKYITMAKVTCSPRLTEEAGAVLKNFYIKDREEAEQRESAQRGGGKIPITVRQLEAIIRMSEALAKIEFSNEVKIKHVEESHRLFKISTLHAAKSGFSTSF